VLVALAVPVLAIGGGPEPAGPGYLVGEEASGPALTKGWVVGTDTAGRGVILHTSDGGKEWCEQGDRSRWMGYWGADVSAVDGQVAWAALEGPVTGMVVHTRNGGKTWVEQPVPAGVGPIKQVRGLSRKVAWAASIDGTILHTTNGGKVWEVVAHPSVPIGQVNRMDARGVHNSDVWVVDETGGRWGMIHTQDNGRTWRQEFVDYPPYAPSNGLHMVCAYSRSVAWCAAWDLGILYRTTDGGEVWSEAGELSGPNDIDDMCSPTAETVWAVQNLSGDSGGTIFHARLSGGQLEVHSFDPTHQHIFEGITCSDDRHAVVVGSRAVGVDPSLPLGVILATKDGGATWADQPLPVSDVAFWKVSFVGARR
jgi:photosystem II stability/assembly factor-like uncharacterized protein